MLKPIRIFRHDNWIEAGYFVETLERHKLVYEVVALDSGDSVPNKIDQVSGLAFLGGAMSVNDSFSWIEDELNLIRKAAERKLPVFGHCFGAQLISKALGGSINAMPTKEIGWYPIEILENEITNKWFSKLSMPIDAMLWHKDAMTIPQGAIPLCSTTFCANQAFTIGNMIASIPHIELTATMLARWLDIYGYDLAPLSASVQSVEDVSQNIDERVSKMHQLTDVLYDHWLDMVKTCN